MLQDITPYHEGIQAALVKAQTDADGRSKVSKFQLFNMARRSLGLRCIVTSIPKVDLLCTLSPV